MSKQGFEKIKKKHNFAYGEDIKKKGRKPKWRAERNKAHKASSRRNVNDNSSSIQ